MTAKPPKKPSYAQLRFRQLLAELREEFHRENGRYHGWNAHAARLLGRGQDDKDGYVRQVYEGSKNAGVESIESAVRHGLKPWSWFGPGSGTIQPGDTETGKLAKSDSDALVHFLAEGTMSPVSDAEVDRLHDWALASRRRGSLEPEDFAEQLAFLRSAAGGDGSGD